MKKFILILLFSSASFAMAQEDPADKIQALKIAFISQKLQLTTDEAQKFWPVYNNYETDMRQALTNRKDNVLENDEKLLNVRKRFKPEFEKILGQPRVNKFFGAEREFRGVLMKQLKNNKGGERNPNRGGAGKQRPLNRR
jgi:hypothetical protein